MTYRESLTELVAPLNPSTGVEVGVHRGATSALLLKRCPRLVLHMVDSWIVDDFGIPSDKQEEFYREARRNVMFATDRTRIHRADSVVVAKSLTGLDFAFIDACHKYESVRDDLAAWWPAVRTGGLYCGHDYGKPEFGVTQAVDEWASIMGVKIQTKPGHIWWTEKS